MRQGRGVSRLQIVRKPDVGKTGDTNMPTRKLTNLLNLRAQVERDPCNANAFRNLLKSYKTCADFNVGELTGNADADLEKIEGCLTDVANIHEENFLRK